MLIRLFVYKGWTLLISSGLLIAILVAWGIKTVLAATISTMDLVIGFYLASLGGVFIGFTAAESVSPAPEKCVQSLLLALIAWRISYFPLLVIAGTLGCYYELMMSLVNISNAGLFAALFVILAILNTLLALLVSLSVPFTKVRSLLAILVLLPSCLISFVSLSDFTLLPDRGFENIASGLKARQPIKNTYRHFIDDDRINVGQKTVALAGALLYPIIPNSPWAQRVKGTLENAFRNNPSGTSYERLQDHYAAFALAY